MGNLTEAAMDIVDHDGSGPNPVNIADRDTPSKKLSVVQDGDVLSTQSGLLLYGQDGSNLQALSTNISGRLQVDVISGGTSGQQVLDGAVAVPATDFGTISAGFDGTNYQFLSVAANGRLQVDIVGGGGSAGQLVIDGTVAVPATDVGRIQAGFDGTNYQFVAVDTAGHLKMTIVDPTTPSQVAAVDVSGRLQVSTQAPTPPPATTSIVQTIDGSLGNNAVFNSYYTVTNTKTLEIQRFIAAGEGGATNGWFFELYEDPLGTGVAGTNPVPASWVLIELMVVPDVGDSKFVDLSNTTYIGDGTRRIVLRAVRLGAGGAKRGFMKFTGFEQ